MPTEQLQGPQTPMNLSLLCLVLQLDIWVVSNKNLSNQNQNQKKVYKLELTRDKSQSNPSF